MPFPVLATGETDVLVPHLDERGQAGYASFLASPSHRAFVIAPGGTWAWNAEMPSQEMALEAALQDCRRVTEQQCVPYAVDDRVVFDAESWPLAWGPYLSSTQAAEAAVGMRRVERFPDLVFQSPSGKQGKLSDMRGKVVVLHFWGSWCPPCQREMPELQKLNSLFEGANDVAFVLLPVREPLETARQWAVQKNISLPIFSGGDATGQAEEFILADGAKLSDRQLAKAFPTTYILDKHGVVVFSHIGPVARWLEFAPFLKDAVAKSGK
jgi:thiol-disulfide isomerase/thioredoxin